MCILAPSSHLETYNVKRKNNSWRFFAYFHKFPGEAIAPGNLPGKRAWRALTEVSRNSFNSKSLCDSYSWSRGQGTVSCKIRTFWQPQNNHKENGHKHLISTITPSVHMVYTVARPARHLHRQPYIQNHFHWGKLCAKTYWPTQC
jgi:hypothetical protein